MSKEKRCQKLGEMEQKKKWYIMSDNPNKEILLENMYSYKKYL